MSRPRSRAPLRLAVVVLLFIVAGASPVGAQGASSFRLIHTVDRSAPDKITVNGRVFNDARSDAIDVYVTAEALDAAGKVVASGVSYVGAVSAGSSAAFIIKVPSGRAPANFRVIVTSFRFGFATQS